MDNLRRQAEAIAIASRVLPKSEFRSALTRLGRIYHRLSKRNERTNIVFLDDYRPRQPAAPSFRGNYALPDEEGHKGVDGLG